MNEKEPAASEDSGNLGARPQEENSKEFSVNPLEKQVTKAAPSKAASLASSKDASGGGTWLKRLFKVAIGIVVAGFLIATVRQAVIELQAQESPFDIRKTDWRFLLLAVATYGIALLPPAIAWLWVLDDFKQKLPRRAALHAFFIGHLGKYVPGKAMVLVLRVGKLQPFGLGLRAGIVSVFVETLTSVCVAALLGGVLILFLNVPAWIKWASIACIPPTIIAMTPHFFRIGLFTLAKSKIGKMPPPITNAFTPKFMLRTHGGMLIAWLLMGTSGWFIFLSLSPSSELWSWYGWASVVCAVCLGAVAGFASMIPGGAVVREIVITWLLEPIVGQPIALLGSILFRLTQIIAELLVIAWFYSPKLEETKPKQRQESPTKRQG